MVFFVFVLVLVEDFVFCIMCVFFFDIVRVFSFDLGFILFFFDIFRIDSYFCFCIYYRCIYEEEGLRVEEMFINIFLYIGFNL